MIRNCCSPGPAKLRAARDIDDLLDANEVFVAGTANRKFGLQVAFAKIWGSITFDLWQVAKRRVAATLYRMGDLMSKGPGVRELLACIRVKCVYLFICSRAWQHPGFQRTDSNQSRCFPTGTVHRERK